MTFLLKEYIYMHIYFYNYSEIRLFVLNIFSSAIMIWFPLLLKPGQNEDNCCSWNWNEPLLKLWQSIPPRARDETINITISFGFILEGFQKLHFTIGMSKTVGQYLSHLKWVLFHIWAYRLTYLYTCTPFLFSFLLFL